MSLINADPLEALEPRRRVDWGAFLMVEKQYRK